MKKLRFVAINAEGTVISAQELIENNCIEGIPFASPYAVKIPSEVGRNIIKNTDVVWCGSYFCFESEKDVIFYDLKVKKVVNAVLRCEAAKAYIVEEEMNYEA